MKKLHGGFTLIELMIVIAIIGILAAVALPAYQDYAVRSKISEAIIAASAVKSLISEAYQTDNTVGMTSAAERYNVTPIQQKQSKYISDITIEEGTTWAITVVISGTADNGIPTILNSKTLVFSPNVQKAIPLPQSVGAIDWACGSLTVANATNRGFANKVAGTLPAKYAPSECR